MKKIIIKTLVVFIAVFGIINIKLLKAQESHQNITLTDIWASATFYPNMPKDVYHMNDGKHYCILENRIMLNEYSYKDDKNPKTIIRTSKLIPKGKDKGIPFDDYKFNAHESKILIATNQEPIYRHSTHATYYIFDIKTGKLTLLSDTGKQGLATFSPDGFNVAFIRNNNLFVKNIKNNVENQITNDGLYNNIINGSPDWVYEEEFGFTKAFFWSPDGSKIAFYKFDESKVKEFFLTEYNNLYPEEYKYKYPKAGEDNSIVSIYVYNIESKTTKKMDIGKETNQYIPRIKWTQDSNVLSIQRMNRLQNKLEILLADANTGNFKVVYTEKNKYYIDITDNLTFLKDNKHFIFTNETNGYNHIYLYYINGKLIRQLTKGNWEVEKIKGVDNKNEIIYYISSETSPVNRDLYAIKLDGTDKVKLSTKQGTNKVSFSKGYKYYINTFSDANTPPYITVNATDGKKIRVLEDNAHIIKATKNYGFTKKEFFSFKTSDTVELNAWMIKPPNFDSTKKYPVFMYVYGGPGSQTVKNDWGYFDFAWFQMLAQKGYITVSVDNRGTGARGEEFEKCTYMELGKLETIDQIESAKYLGNLNYIDSNRIGIFGWSYGGYMSILCMTKGADYFKSAIAVAPVTNWRYYDNIYTERFMRTPQENPNGYDDNSPINYVKKLKGKLLLIHGTADDNVHLQNSMELINSLVNANKQFEMQLYPNKNHGIYGGYTRLHLYTKMTDFILKNL